MMNYNRILFVEDNLVFGLIHAEFWRDCGFEVIHATSASQALETLTRGEPIDALITDVHLGQGSNGFDVARAARRIHPGLPVLITSGDDRERQRCESLYDTVFILKPYHPIQIVDALVPGEQRAVA